jgi:hypothetical protein
MKKTTFRYRNPVLPKGGFFSHVKGEILHGLSSREEGLHGI